MDSGSDYQPETVYEDVSGYKDATLYDQKFADHGELPPDYSSYNYRGMDETMNVPEPRHMHSTPDEDSSSVYLQVIISYLFAFIGAALVIIAGSKTQFVQFHAHQGVVVSTVLWIFCLIWLWNIIGFLVVWAFIFLALLLLAGKACYDYSSETYFKLPLVGPWAFRMAERRLMATHIRG